MSWNLVNLYLFFTKYKHSLSDIPLYGQQIGIFSKRSDNTELIEVVINKLVVHKC